MFVFGVDATRTPVDDDICIEGGATGLGDESVSRDPPRAVPEMKVEFVGKPKVAFAFVAAVVAVTTVLLPEFSISDGNGGKAEAAADC